MREVWREVVGAGLSRPVFFDEPAPQLAGESLPADLAWPSPFNIRAIALSGFPIWGRAGGGFGTIIYLEIEG